MDVLPLHAWDLSPSEAIALQKELAALVLPVGSPSEEDVALIAGTDVAFDKPNGRGVGAIVVLRYPSLEVVEQVTVEAPVTFPYVPGLLSFRETPVLLAAFERLLSVPDLLMIDGHGYAHPRRFGFACHLGVLLDIPTIGVAKSRLIGEHASVGRTRGSRADLTHDGDVLGSVLRTREGVRAVYVSVGQKIGLDAAERWALACTSGYRVPEPTRLADRLAGRAKRRMLEATLPIIIEQRAGEEGRWEWKPETDTVEFQHTLEPMPAHYGCSIDIINPADGELLDVMLLDARPYDRAERATVRVIDILRRSDGDDKLLAVPIDRPWPPEALIEHERREIWAWYTRHNKPITGWGGEDDAIAAIHSCREAATEASKL